MWISPIEMNMNISRSIYEGKPQYCLIATVQKIAIYTVIPFLLIAMLEAIIKNVICINLLNCLITLLNGGRDLYTHYFPKNPSQETP